MPEFLPLNVASSSTEHPSSDTHTRPLLPDPQTLRKREWGLGEELDRNFPETAEQWTRFCQLDPKQQIALFQAVQGKDNPDLKGAEEHLPFLEDFYRTHPDICRLRLSGAQENTR